MSAEVCLCSCCRKPQPFLPGEFVNMHFQVTFYGICDSTHKCQHAWKPCCGKCEVALSFWTAFYSVELWEPLCKQVSLTKAALRNSSFWSQGLHFWGRKWLLLAGYFWQGTDGNHHVLQNRLWILLRLAKTFKQQSVMSSPSTWNKCKGKASIWEDNMDVLKIGFYSFSCYF